eukprot:XP_006525130.1 PREDICTED: uncharacterized protein LOC75462 isoform X1 [Mus musculus]
MKGDRERQADLSPREGPSVPRPVLLQTEPRSVFPGDTSRPWSPAALPARAPGDRWCGRRRRSPGNASYLDSDISEKSRSASEEEKSHALGACHCAENAFQDLQISAGRQAYVTGGGGPLMTKYSTAVAVTNTYSRSSQDQRSTGAAQSRKVSINGEQSWPV